MVMGTGAPTLMPTPQIIFAAKVFPQTPSAPAPAKPHPRGFAPFNSQTFQKRRVRDATEYRKEACRGDETAKAPHNGEFAADRLTLKRNGEPSMLSLVLGAICFAGIHLGIAGTALRDRAIAAT